MTQMAPSARGPGNIGDAAAPDRCGYETILNRLAALPAAVDQQLALLQDGLKREYTPPKIALRDLPKQIAGLTPADALASPLLQTFGEFPSNFPEAERGAAHRKSQQHLCREHYTGVSQAARLRRFHLPSRLPRKHAATALPNGAAAYAFHIRWQTTLNLTFAANSRDWARRGEAHSHRNG